MTKRGMKPFDSVGNHASFHSDAEKGDEQGVIQSLRTIAQTNDYILDNGIIDILSRFCVLFLLLLLLTPSHPSWELTPMRVTRNTCSICHSLMPKHRLSETNRSRLLHSIDLMARLLSSSSSLQTLPSHEVNSSMPSNNSSPPFLLSMLWSMAPCRFRKRQLRLETRRRTQTQHTQHWKYGGRAGCSQPPSSRHSPSLPLATHEGTTESRDHGSANNCFLFSRPFRNDNNWSSWRKEATTTGTGFMRRWRVLREW